MRKLVEGSKVVCTFEGGEDVSVDMDELSPEVVTQLALHGLKQKLGDSIAGKTADTHFLTVQAVAETLKAGNWTVKSSVGGKVVEALIAYSGKTPEECRTLYGDMDKGERKQLAKHPSIVKELAVIELRRAEAKAATTPEGADEALTALFN